MAHFAKVQNGVVVEVIVADPEFIASGAVGDPATWIQTSYNTHGGVHYGPDGKPNDGLALRKNYAGVGYTYDSGLDAFYAPQPFPSWSLNKQTCLWVSPVSRPDDGQQYEWDEQTRSWVQQA